MRDVGVPRCFLAGNNQVGDLGQNNHTSLTFPRSHDFPNVSDFSRNFVSKILQQVSRCSERAIHHGVSKGASRVSHRRCLCHQYHLNHARLETKHHQRDVCHYFVLWLNGKAAVNDGESSGEWWRKQWWMMSGIFDFVVILHMILQYFTKIDPVELFTLHHVVSLVWVMVVWNR